MWETGLVVLIVFAAAAGVGYQLYRSAAGKSGCAGCSGCSQAMNLSAADSACRQGVNPTQRANGR
ncbi:MAG TPA: FeoB-associated Cys-rich membrane protein [Phycisphaerales bacterium]|nr:FeoB-associated Cys-rich membrane protein [Phycisphaerales bacterium]